VVGGMEWALDIAPVGDKGKRPRGCRMVAHAVGGVLVKFAGSGLGEGELRGLEVGDCFTDNVTVPVLLSGMQVVVVPVGVYGSRGVVLGAGYPYTWVRRFVRGWRMVLRRIINSAAPGRPRPCRRCMAVVVYAVPGLWSGTRRALPLAFWLSSAGVALCRRWCFPVTCTVRSRERRLHGVGVGWFRREVTSARVHIGQSLLIDTG
jgi:hypothetical protein